MTAVLWLLLQKAAYIDRRGSYDRSGDDVQKRLSLPQMAWNHHEAIERGDLKECSPQCPFGARCFRSLSTNDLLACHELSFGSSVAWDDKLGRPTLQQTTAETQQSWRSIMKSLFVFDKHGKLSPEYTFTVANMRVCEECMRMAYGIPASTWSKYMRVGKTSPRALDMFKANMELSKSERSDANRDIRCGSKHSDAMTWWLDWLHW